MENGQRNAAVNCENVLPEDIIQQIQSFISGKQAAQTSILSKSWYSAWLTRPNLDFDQRDFHADGFWEFVRRTMQRYQELKRKIDSLRLCMSSQQHSIPLANELIVEAMKMGAIDLGFELETETPSFVLPHEVLVSENLVSLSVIGCRIELGPDGKVSCSKLKYLSLHRVYIASDIIQYIMTSCPLLETMSLSACECWSKMQSTLQWNFFDFRKHKVGLVVHDPMINPYEFCKLKCLSLGQVNLDEALFFRDFSSIFPSLKDLTLHHCGGCNDIQISSRSLECVSVAHNRRLRAKFHVPIIRKFRFSGSRLPSLSLKTASMEWESDVSITCQCSSTSWFSKLRKFLRKLRRSKISLSLEFRRFLEESFDYAGDAENLLPRTAVENLMLSIRRANSISPSLLDGLFWSCRPKFVSEWFRRNSDMEQRGNRDFLDFMCRTLMREGSEDCCIPNRKMFRLHHLQEVNVEVFDESLAEWRLLPWKTLLDAVACPERKQKIRFQLSWGGERVALK